MMGFQTREFGGWGGREHLASASCGSHKGSQLLLPRGGKRKEGTCQAAKQGCLPRCLVRTLHKGQAGAVPAQTKWCFSKIFAKALEGIEWYPCPKFMFPKNSEYDFIWKPGLCRCNWLRISG